MEKPDEMLIIAGKSQIPFEFINRKAFQWQRKRTPVVHPNPAFDPDQITHFPSWNAHSIFFIDPAGNLLEYIARHDLNNGADGAFSTKDILYLSEIGFITEDVKATGEHLMKVLSMTEYRSVSSGFWPIGDLLT